ncbi:MAG: lectin like domain-containing protein, partial [Planctomycetota bacterium]
FTPDLNHIGERLHAVSFFNATQNVNYVVRVYDDFDGTQLYNEIVSASGFIAEKGFHTIDLNPKPFLTYGDNIYVYVSLDKGGHPFDRTSEVPVLLGSDERVTVISTSSPGESFYREGGVWKDMYNYNDSANFCMKALTIIEPAVYFSFPNGKPKGGYPIGVSLPIDIQITPGLGNYIPGSGKLHYRFDPDDDFEEVPFVHVGGDMYHVDFPHTLPGSKPEYYFSADGDCGTTAYMPKKAPGRVYDFECWLEELKSFDDCETDTGWKVKDYYVTDGNWERGDPSGTSAQPEDDHTPGGSKCWVTGKAGGAAGDDDFDGGPSYLITPPIDLEGADAYVSFYLYFYHSSTGKQQPLDICMANNGLSFYSIATVKHKPEWTKYTFKVSEHVEPTNKVQLQFRAWDYPDDSIVEILVDDLRVDYIEYEPTLWADAYSISVGAAKTIEFSLDAGVANAGRSYLILGSMSGNIPGYALPGGEMVHINWDWFTDFLLGCLGTSMCQDFHSNLDVNGQGQAVLNTLGPVDPALIGQTATFAYFLSQPPAWDFCSNSIGVSFDP